ncbi:MAG: dephospho-CoA kinase [candidate division Zixibacteria bacterium]|nr:dephospho-CoA kinase [candidate division Zixibacteria bacterium]MDD5426052.1 dephospho-CoA kinase [candidate division Zixibacteria bacterium]
MLMGLTGQLGSGKTTAANFFKRMGVMVINADHIGREVVEGSRPLLKKLVRAFGHDILDKKGRLKRKRLAMVAFASRENHARLNALVHPYLLKKLRKQLAQAEKKQKIVVVDAALLMDWRLDREMDYVLVIHASLQKRLERLIRRGITRRDALARLKRQLPYRIFQKRADRVIFNNGSIAELEKKLNKLLAGILPQTD